MEFSQRSRLPAEVMTGAPRSLRACVVCHKPQVADCFAARERLLGTGETFAYWECPGCESVQIDAVPDDLERHYPREYFAYREHHRLARNRLRRLVDPHRLRAAMGARDLIGAIANRVLKPLDFARWCQVTGVQRHQGVLDVGCGTGKLLLRMSLAGFSNTLGLDPFIARSLTYECGVRVVRQDLECFAAQSARRFGLVMFHHSLEHLADPLASLKAAVAVLDDDGWVLVRIPVSGNHAWRQYREHWFALDPPRHLFVPSEQGMRVLAARAGLQVSHVHYDSTYVQFTHSELCRQGIAGSDVKGFRRRFSKGAIRRLARDAARLNDRGDGDQAAFFLTRAR